MTVNVEHVVLFMFDISINRFSIILEVVFGENIWGSGVFVIVEVNPHIVNGVAVVRI